MATDIKQIQIGTEVHDIDAKKWGGHTFSEVENLIHGVVDTYVIPTTKSSTSGYSTVVGATTTQVSTTVGALKGLVSNPPSNAFDQFNVGDVILMGATSDGKKNFDRWVSNVSGTGDTAVITLDILETQVAKHHHTINVPTVSHTSATVLTSAKVGSTTTSNMAYVGTAVTVVTGASNADEVVITSVGHDGNGSYDLKLTTTASSGYAHTHTVNAHKHSVTYDKTIVSRNIGAYTALSTKEYTPHTHTVVSVAGEAKAGGLLPYITGTKSSATFIKTLTDASTTTNTGSATPGTTAVSLTTSTQVSATVVGDTVKTASNGSHTHTVTTTTDTDVVTAATVAAKVVTSVSFSHTAPTVAAKVVTSVSYSSASTVTSWTASVDTSGVLSFNVPRANRISSITVPSLVNQSAGSASLNAPRTDQSCTFGSVNSTGSAASAGSHQHGFNHTHTIAAHSHTVNNHTHTYKKTVVSTSETAITSLNSSTFTLHTHTNTTVAGTSTDLSTPITYVYGGSTTSVVRDLTTSSASATVGNTSPQTDKVFQQITGTITYPGISAETKKLADMLATGSIKPAEDSGEKPAMSVTTSTKDVVKNVTVGSSSAKTSTNVGGE